MIQKSCPGSSRHFASLVAISVSESRNSAPPSPPRTPSPAEATAVDASSRL